VHGPARSGPRPPLDHVAVQVVEEAGLGAEAVDRLLGPARLVELAGDGERTLRGAQPLPVRVVRVRRRGEVLLLGECSEPINYFRWHCSDDLDVSESGIICCEQKPIAMEDCEMVTNLRLGMLICKPSKFRQVS
jgi:hypothetical protein